MTTQPAVYPRNELLFLPFIGLFSYQRILVFRIVEELGIFVYLTSV